MNQTAVLAKAKKERCRTPRSQNGKTARWQQTACDVEMLHMSASSSRG
jgi:hypothetical protein